MFDFNHVRKCMNRDTFESALRLINGKYISKTTYNSNRYPLITIKAEVSLSPLYPPYHPVVTIDDADPEIISHRCSCRYDNFGYGSLCAHEAAALIVYASARDDGRISFEEGAGKSITDHRVRFFLEDAAPSLSGDMSASVYIEPHAWIERDSNTDEDALSVQFRIGRTGTSGYVLKSIDTLISSLNEQRNINYGKKLSFVPCMQSFAPESRPLVQFLKSLSNNHDSFRETRFYGFSYYPRSVDRFLTLRGRYLDAFIQAVRSTGIYMRVSEYSDKESLLRLSSNPPAIHMTFRPDGTGIRYMPEIPPYIAGLDAIYFFDYGSGEIQTMPADQSAGFLSALSFSSDLHGADVFIDSDDIRPFIRRIYPMIQKSSELETNDFELSVYVPAKPEFVFYLECPQNNMITCESYAVYQGTRYNIHDGSAARSALRNPDAEKAMEDSIAPYFNSYDPDHLRMVIIDDDDLMMRFLQEGVPSLQEMGEVYISESLKRLQVRSLSRFSLGVSVKSDLLQLEMMSDERTLEDLAEILSRYSPKKKYYRLKNGSFVTIDDEASLEEFVRFSEDLQLSAKDIAKGSASIPSYRAMYIEKSAGADSSLEISRDEYFRSLVDGIEDETAAQPLPEHLEDILREYQKNGFQWLHRLYRNHFSGLLADEMGLGKTIQVIAFLSSLKERGRCIIICPASLVYNWRNEFRRFAPEIETVLITGSAPLRRELISESSEHAVLITSYDAMKRDIDVYEGLKFDVEVIDEAQYIKNAATQAAESVKAINAGFRIALTGTPIENRLSELWSIFDFLLPGFLYRYNWFRTHFEMPIVKDQNSDAQERLRRMITPFILRRLKRDVLTDLPEKLEEIYYAPLEGEQKELYDARRQRLKIMLAKESDQSFSKKKIEVLAELTRLRQTCCAPALIYDNYRGNSAKEDLCIELIQRAIQGGHKILLFSQFKTMLERLNKRLEKEKIAYHFLSGETPKEKRAMMVEAFQNDDVPVFSISLKAGGTGLNLTAADIVIHYDPWWNTAAENQASDRTHRIGQENVVTVYKLIVEDTVEERIIELQKEKANLANEILSGDEMSSSSLTREQLMDIL